MRRNRHSQSIWSIFVNVVGAIRSFSLAGILLFSIFFMCGWALQYDLAVWVTYFKGQESSVSLLVTVPIALILGIMFGNLGNTFNKLFLIIWFFTLCVQEFNIMSLPNVSHLFWNPF